MMVVNTFNPHNSALVGHSLFYTHFRDETQTLNDLLSATWLVGIQTQCMFQCPSGRNKVTEAAPAAGDRSSSHAGIRGGLGAVVATEVTLLVMVVMVRRARTIVSGGSSHGASNRADSAVSAVKSSSNSCNKHCCSLEIFCGLGTGVSCFYTIQFSSVQFSRSVMSNSLRPHESQHARLACPSPTPGVHSNSCPSSR